MPGSGQVHVKSTGERNFSNDSGRTPHARWDILGSDYGLSIALKWSLRGGPGRGPAHYVPLFRPRRDFPLILHLPNSILTATSPSSPLITQSHRLAGISSI